MVGLVNRRDKKRSGQYAFSISAAITQDDIVGFQLVEGGSDGTLFENFIYRVLNQLRQDEKTKRRKIVVFLDNAATHQQGRLNTLAEKFGVTFLFSAAYSPWLQAIENLFNSLKRHLRNLEHKPTK